MKVRFDLTLFHKTVTYAPALCEISWTYCNAVSGGFQPKFDTYVYAPISPV